MAGEMTQAEIIRMIDRLEEAQKTFVNRDLYEANVREIRGDIHEIKEGQRRVIWMIVGILATVIAQIIVFLVTNQI